MKVKVTSLLTIAFFAQGLIVPLQAGCFDSCWGRVAQKEVVSTETIPEEKQVAETRVEEMFSVEKTPFQLCGEAVFNGDVEAFKENLALIEDVDATVSGCNLIGVIAGGGTEEFLEIFLEREPKVDLSIEGERGFVISPLQMACVMNNITVAKALVLKGGADVNFFPKGSDYRGPLHTAIFCQNLELARFFIEQGADVTQKVTCKGREASVLEIAICSGHPVITQLIREALANAEETKEVIVEAEIQIEEAEEVNEEE